MLPGLRLADDGNADFFIENRGITNSKMKGMQMCWIDQDECVFFFAT